MPKADSTTSILINCLRCPGTKTCKRCPGTYHVIVKEQDNYWIDWIEEVPGVNCQESTREEHLESLTITLREALLFNRMDALHAAKESYEELNIAI